MQVVQALLKLRQLTRLGITFSAFLGGSKDLQPKWVTRNLALQGRLLDASVEIGQMLTGGSFL
jgi:hypothetical protein